MVSCPAHRTSNLHSFKAVISQRRRLPAHTSRTADDHLSVREGVKVTTSTGCATRSVASTDYKRWSPYGAPWLQTLAINRKSDQAKNARNKRNSSPWVATSCARRLMVRRGSPVRVRKRALTKAPQTRLLHKASG